MFIKYGKYIHQLNEAYVSVSHNAIESDQNIKIGWQSQWQIQGVLLADNDAADPVQNLTSKINALKTAYGKNGYNIGLYTDDGVVTSHYIKSSDTVQGVRIQSLSFPQGIGSEYATKRTYSISLTADYISDNAARTGKKFIESSQTISTTGTGGPRYVVRETRFGSPVRQLVSQATVVRVSQSGSIKCLGAPPVPTPIYSNYEVFPARTISVTYSEKDKYYHCNYSFQFEAPFPF